jgi:hypothetical protein
MADSEERKITARDGQRRRTMRTRKAISYAPHYYSTSGRARREDDCELRITRKDWLEEH